MQPKNKSADDIRQELIATIKKGVGEVGDNKAIALRLKMTRQNLSYHLNPDGPYKNNIQKLGEIGDVVAQMQAEKRTLAQKILTDVQEKINA